MKNGSVSVDLEISSLKQVYDGFAFNVTRYEAREADLVLYTVKTASGSITLSEKGMSELAAYMQDFRGGAKHA